MKTLELLRGFLPWGKAQREPRTFTIDVPVRRGSEAEESEPPAHEDADGNRRAQARLGRICAIWYRPDGQSHRKAHAVDLTPRGARLILDRKLAVGERFDLTFKILHEDFVTVKARVIWAATLPGGIRNVTGVSFEPLAVDRAGLSEWIRSLSTN